MLTVYSTKVLVIEDRLEIISKRFFHYFELL